MKTSARLVGMLLVAASFVIPCGAAVVTFDATIAYSMDTPGGAPPWCSVSFDDGGGSGTVAMTFSAGNLLSNEFIAALYLNLDPAMDATDLTFSAPTKVGSFDTPIINLDADAYRADFDGWYDILMVFGLGDGATSRFTSGDVLSYSISLAGLTAGSFNYPSISGTLGGYPMSALVGGIGCSGCYGWVTVPEPGCLALLAAGAAGVLGYRRRGRASRGAL